MSLPGGPRRGLASSDGTIIVDFDDLGAVPGELFEASVSPDGSRLVLTWSVAGATNGPWRWTLFERRIDGRFEPRRTLRQPDLAHAVPYSWLDADRVVIPTSGQVLELPDDLPFGYVPAIVDFDTGEVSAVAGFETPEIARRGNLVIGFEAP